MQKEDYTQLTFYMKPEAATALKQHVLSKTGSLRALSPWLRDTVIEKMRAEGVDAPDEWSE